MAHDEAATLKTLNAHRGLMGGLIRQHGGRVVDAVGDNLLAEFPRYQFYLSLGTAHFIARRYEEAVACAKKGLECRSDDNPRAYRLLAASYGHLGRVNEAEVALAEMHGSDRDDPVTYLRLTLPDPYFQHYADGLRKAGWKDDEIG